MLGSFQGANAADTPPTLTQLQAAHDQIAAGNAVVQAWIDNATGALNPQNVTATPGDGTEALDWAVPTNPAGLTGYVYGRDGNDTAGSGAFDSALQPTTTTHAVLDKLVVGSPIHVYVAAVYADGSTTAHRVQLTVTPAAAASPSPSATPSATPTVTPSATPSATPTVTATATVSPTVSTSPTPPPPLNPRVSGLPWSSGVWSDGDRGQEASFVSGPRGGAALDNVLVYADRGTVAQENNPAEWKGEMPADFNGVTQDLVLGLTTWTADGAFMTQAQAAQIGTSLCSVDGTHPIVREDWEMNLNDGAGANGAMLNASNRTAWQTRFIAVANGIKSTCASALIDFNPNHGADQTAGCSGTTCTRAAFQAVKAVVDMYGIDSYDSFPAVKADNSGWNNRLTGTNEMQDALNYAVANGKKFSTPEWGVWCAGTTNCAISNTTDGGNDDPQYIHQMLGFFNTNKANMGYETYFDETNPYIQSDLVSHNPNSRAKYLADVTALRS